MRSLRGLRQWTRWLQLRDPVVPTICYVPCNNAYLEAQAQGKSSGLCASNSTFYSYYTACRDCLETNSNNDTSTKDYLNQEFGQWISYCESTAAPLPETEVITIETSENGHKTVWSFTKTFTPLSRESVAAVTSPLPSASEIDTPLPKGTEKSLAWIAGPIIGGVAGVVIILLAAWLCMKRRRRRGHEVHGDSAFKSELEVKPQPQELDARGQSERPAELPSNAP
ncbi:hypothetical protein GGR51DRAFT_567042 [Nemania sp. FL0031]|nr:hypothetical protein GGR51DRAFT_567042 [Nemania sp. FL0031]